MERLAISGSHGFLGEHLLATLERSGHSVQRLDRTGELPKGMGVVFDLGAWGNFSGQKDPKGIYRANVVRLVKMLDKADKERFILTSSNAVKLEYVSFYTASKLAVEKLGQAFVNERGLKIAVVRPFSVVGVGEQSKHLIPKLIDSCLYGTEIPFVPEPVHDFIDIDDFVDALLVVKDKGLFQGEIYEVGSGTQVSNNEVRLLVEEITSKKANVKLVESMRNYDTKEWYANNERICSLGWKPKKSLRQSIEEMINEKTA